MDEMKMGVICSSHEGDKKWIIKHFSRRTWGKKSLKGPRSRWKDNTVTYPGNGFVTVSLSLQITHEVFYSQPNYFLAIILQLPTQFSSSAPKLTSRQAGVSKLDWLFSTELFFIATLHGSRRKHRLSIVGKACVQRCCIPMEVTRLLLAYLFAARFTESLPSNKRLFWLHYTGFRESCHNIKMHLKETDRRVWTGFIWLRIRSNGVALVNIVTIS
jgi:hypothetical protein